MQKLGIWHSLRFILLSYPYWDPPPDTPDWMIVLSPALAFIETFSDAIHMPSGLTGNANGKSEAAYVGILMLSVPALTRLALAALFIISYILGPLHRPLSTLWARVLEEDQKPVFTLLFGGLAAIIKIIDAFIRFL